MEGRLNVSFEDIKELAYPVLRHRIILNFDAITEGLNEEAIISKILEDLKAVYYTHLTLPTIYSV